MNDAEEEGPYVGQDEVVRYDKVRTQQNAKDRKDHSGGIPIINKSDKNKEIEHSLSKHVRLNFTDTPLEQVLDDLRSWHNINIVPDLPAIESEGISLKRPVSIKLEDVSLKSALNMILHQAHLIWVIKDEVLQVTTEHQANGTLETRTFQVTDLVLPVENYGMPGPADLLRALDDQRRPAGGLQQGQASPYTGPFQMQNGQPVSSPGTPTPPTSPVTPFGRGPGMPGNPTVGGTTVTRSRSQTSEDALIQLIKNTIKPQSWADMGGTGTIEYFPPANTLVVNQASDIQEQIADLLAALRRLQDQEVAIEVRFISIAEGFFERIGLDFNINVKTDRETARFEPQITSQQFKPFGFINDFSPDRFITGLTPAGTFTSDLDIPLKNSSFGMAIPPFGGFPNIPGGNGGIELGLAFLSDIQVFLFMEAAQGDQRTNVMQAPKLTMYNGQTASLSVTDSQFFVTNVNVVQVQGQLAFFPNNSPFPTQGVNLTVQAVISADRRYVRLSLAPILTNLASAVVPLFPIVTPIIPTFEGGFQGQPVVFTQFIQQPVINFISVQTTVNVPDGGTVLMGGLKRLSEGRNEFGPPVLSKIPYINRLFKNVGYGREAESLMIMVTPRVIINEEEEYRQTGVGRPPE